MGLKPWDGLTFPACHGHHREQHTIGEPEFQRRYGLNLRAICLEYAARSPVAEVRERATIELARAA